MQARWGQQAVARFELYHDESKVAGYWHGILLVPEAEKARLVGLLCTALDRFRRALYSSAGKTLTMWPPSG